MGKTLLVDNNIDCETGPLLASQLSTWLDDNFYAMPSKRLQTEFWCIIYMALHCKWNSELGAIQIPDRARGLKAHESERKWSLTLKYAHSLRNNYLTISNVQQYLNMCRNKSFQIYTSKMHCWYGSKCTVCVCVYVCARACGGDLGAPSMVQDPA